MDIEWNNISSIYRYAKLQIPDEVLNMDRQFGGYSVFPDFTLLRIGKKYTIPKSIVRDMLEVWTRFEHEQVVLEDVKSVTYYVCRASGLSFYDDSLELGQLLYQVLRMIHLRKKYVLSFQTAGKLGVALGGTSKYTGLTVSRRATWHFILSTLQHGKVVKYNPDCIEESFTLTEKGVKLYRILRWAFNYLKRNNQND